MEPIDTGALPRRKSPECSYCPADGADVCVRVHEGNGRSLSVYAHRACAKARNVPVLYEVLPMRTEHFG